MGFLDCGDCLTKVYDVRGGDPCNNIDYGTQITQIFLQDPLGANFDGTTGNDVTLPADWAAKRAATGTPDFIAKLQNVVATKPTVDPNIIEGADVPYGLVEVIDYDITITGDIIYVSKETFEDVERQTFCGGYARMWFLTNRDWLFGAGLQADADLGNGFEVVRFMHKTSMMENLGTRLKIPFEIRYNTQCDVKPIGQFPFLRDI